MMNTALTHEHLEVLAAMVDLGQQDRAHYLATYAEENEESPEEIAAGHRQIDLASEALTLIHGESETPAETVESGTDEEEEEGPAHLITISADFRVTGDADSIRGPLERPVADLLEDGSNDGIYSIPGSSVNFLCAEVTAHYPEQE